MAFWWTIRTGRRSREIQYLLSLFVPLFGFYVVLSFNDSGQPNWTAPAYVAGVILLASQWLDPIRQKSWARRMAVAAALLALIQTFLLHDTLAQSLPGRDP